MFDIDLSAPRVLTLDDRGKQYTYTLDPIDSASWKKYFAGVVSLSEVVDKQRVDRFENSVASAQLVRTAVADIAGYRFSGGTRPENWRELLPLGHLLAIGGTLRNVSRAEADADAVMLGEEQVSIEAAWGDPERGNFLHKGLVHRFQTTSVEHQRKYSREASRSVITGGSRTGQTRWMGAQNALMEIYDELVVGVEGYTAEGRELGDDVERIRRSMDGYHKVVAAEALFAPAVVTEKQESTEAA